MSRIRASAAVVNAMARALDAALNKIPLPPSPALPPAPDQDRAGRR